MTESEIERRLPTLTESDKLRLLNILIKLFKADGQARSAKKRVAPKQVGRKVRATKR